MKITRRRLHYIINRTLRECGEPMTHDDSGLEGVVDAIVNNVEPLQAGHGGKSRMARGHLYHIANRAQSLHDRLTDEDELPEWVQSKLAVAESMVNAVYDHLDYKIHKGGMDDSHDVSISDDVENMTGSEAFAVGLVAGREGLA